MSDPLGFEVSSTPQAIVQREGAAHAMTRLLNAYRNDLLLPGLHLVDRDQPVPEPIGDDGEPLTYERRLAIAASRPKFDNLALTEQDFRDVGDITPEQIGTSAEAAMFKGLKIVRAKKLELPLPEGELVLNTKEIP